MQQHRLCCRHRPPGGPHTLLCRRTAGLSRTSQLRACGTYMTDGAADCLKLSHDASRPLSKQSISKRISTRRHACLCMYMVIPSCGVLAAHTDGLQGPRWCTAKLGIGTIFRTACAAFGIPTATQNRAVDASPGLLRASLSRRSVVPCQTPISQCVPVRAQPASQASKPLIAAPA